MPKCVGKAEADLPRTECTLGRMACVLDAGESSLRSKCQNARLQTARKLGESYDLKGGCALQYYVLVENKVIGEMVDSWHVRPRCVPNSPLTCPPARTPTPGSRRRAQPSPVCPAAQPAAISRAPSERPAAYLVAGQQREDRPRHCNVIGTTNFRARSRTVGAGKVSGYRSEGRPHISRVRDGDMQHLGPCRPPHRLGGDIGPPDRTHGDAACAAHTRHRRLTSRRTRAAAAPAAHATCWGPSPSPA